MKTAFLIVVCSLICGCEPQKPKADPRDAKIAALEKKVQDMEADFADQELLARSNHVDFLKGHLETLRYITNLQARVDAVETRVDEIRDQSTPHQNVLTRGYAPARQILTPAIVAEIKRKAEQEWPGNYEMQAYEIKQQTEAFHKVNP